MYKQIEGFKFPYRISDKGIVEKEIAPGKWQQLVPYLNHGSLWVKLRRDNAKSKSVRVMTLMRDYFMGGEKEAMRVARKSASIFDCSLSNLHWIPASKATNRARKAHRRSVEKIDAEGNVIELYSSVQEAAKKNFVATMTVIRRCKNRIKNPCEFLGYTFRYER